jgi:hypothetical protein
MEFIQKVSELQVAPPLLNISGYHETEKYVTYLFIQNEKIASRFDPHSVIFDTGYKNLQIAAALAQHDKRVFRVVEFFEGRMMSDPYDLVPEETA